METAYRTASIIDAADVIGIRLPPPPSPPLLGGTFIRTGNRASFGVIWNRRNFPVCRNHYRTRSEDLSDFGRRGKQRDGKGDKEDVITCFSGVFGAIRITLWGSQGKNRQYYSKMSTYVFRQNKKCPS